MLRTKTSKHCIICNCCYDNFDHHCYWINKCVAKNNFALFIIFLFITTFYLLISFILIIFGLINIKIFNSDDFNSENFCEKHFLFKTLNSYKPCDIIYNDKFILHLILNIILTLIVLLFLIPQCFLLFLHINVIFSNYREEKINNKNNIRISETPLIDENEESFYNSMNN